MKKKIAILLPYKEKYTHKEAAAASIWVKDYLKNSKLSKETIVFGNLPKHDKPLTKNFINLNLDNVKFKKNYFYTKKFLEYFYKYKFKVIEIHNRPESLVYLINKKIKSKFIFIYHNNPKDIRFSKSIKERKYILDKCDQILFISHWVKRQFFDELETKYRNNCEVMPHATNQQKIFPKNKKKVIIFTGKLNYSKGYDVFGKICLKLLKKYKDWSALAIGNERRETYNFKHKRFRVLDWQPHKKIINHYKKSSISIVCSRWQEPFGRTAMESAACGCATIISNRGGLKETFDAGTNVIENLNSDELEKKIVNFINNKKFMLKIQKENFYNVVNKIKNLASRLDEIKRFFLLNNVNIVNGKSLKILHIGNFGQRSDHRLFNISIANKLSNGLIRNNHDVINFSYRDFHNKAMIKSNNVMNDKIFKIVENYKPNLVLLGHNNILNRETISSIKSINNSKIALWYEDHLIKGGPNYKNNLDLIEKNQDLIDQYFVTTYPASIKTKISKKKIHFMPIPADQNIENLEIYNSNNRFKDLFFALSHGVNYGKLKGKYMDERESFLNELMKKNKKLTFNILGYSNEQPKWNYQYYDELIKCKMALNLSRGRPSKWASSNRIASLVANGIMTFIDKKTEFSDFFNPDEMGFYKDAKDLLHQMERINGNMSKINKISMNGKRRYFSIFNNSIVSEYILHKTFDIKNKFKYVWE